MSCWPIDASSKNEMMMDFPLLFFGQKGKENYLTIHGPRRGVSLFLTAGSMRLSRFHPIPVAVLPMNKVDGRASISRVHTFFFLLFLF